MARFRPRRALTLAAVIAAAAAGVVVLAPSAQATTATIYVGGSGASDSHACTSAAAPCATINGGVTKALASGATDVTVDIAPGTYHEALALGQVPSGNSVNLVGTGGAAVTTIDATGKNAPVILYPTSTTGPVSGVLNVTGLTVTGGSNPFTGSGFGAGSGYGAGIIVGTGTLNVSDSVIEGNDAAFGGGGIYAIQATLNVSRTTVTNNTGGGITDLSGTASVTDSQITNNVGHGGGGGIEAQGTLTVINSTVTGNSLDGSGANAGGGIYNFGTATVTGSTISGNSAGDGGGIENASGNLTVTSSTISGNTATGQGGGVASGGTLTLTNSTVANNTASGGGGIYIQNGTATVTQSTISGNSATSAGGNAGGIENSGTLVTVSGSILSGDTANGTALECSGNVVTNGGYNVTSGDSCGFSTVNGSIVSTVSAIGLGPLAANGSTGPQTEAISASSSAHQVVPTASCLPTDERGLPRPGYDSATHCDSGAYELQQLPTTAQAISFAGPSSPVSYGVAPITLSASATSSLSVTFTVTGPCSVSGTTLTVTGAGNCVITAHQAGNRTYLPAADVSHTLVITKAATTTTLAVTPASPAVNQPVTLTATVHWTGTGVAPTGTVSFYDGSTLLGTAPLQTDGTAAITTTFGGGPHAITATYSGDSRYAASSSTPPQNVVVSCDHVVTGSVSGGVVLAPGTTCLLHANVSGGISVPAGATLDLENSTVSGSISANHPAGIRICGSTTGAISVSAATGYVRIGDRADNCKPNTVNGGLTAANNTAGGTISGNTITGTWLITKNTPAFTATGNHH